MNLTKTLIVYACDICIMYAVEFFFLGNINGFYNYNIFGVDRAGETLEVG